MLTASESAFKCPPQIFSQKPENGYKNEKVVLMPSPELLSLRKTGDNADIPSGHVQNHTLNPTMVPRRTTIPILYCKSHLCKKWETGGECPDLPNCRYSHGLEERCFFLKEGLKRTVGIYGDWIEVFN